MSSIGVLLCQGGQALREAGIEGARQEARLLLGHAMGATAEDLLRDPRAEVPPEAATRFHSMLERRMAREPLAHITGFTGFWTLELEVSPATLVPRPDSETVIEALLAEDISPQRILDLGTGTGCLLLAALAESPRASGVGIDLVPEAVALARRNAARNGLGDRAQFLAGHWSDAISGRFDAILSNPPYIESDVIAGLMPEVARHEPDSALDGGADGLDAYRDIVARLPCLLTEGGRAFLELGQGQAPAVSALAREAGLLVRGERADLGEISRVLILSKP
ncbi:peptide chain release factor N(5)-glutamine methyltransferase [Roseococcus sp. YIM B11640]|uniref:peptide chain release factor N(5)-glutamine methyltransferase n=1 Tax=Roseococcus sp. YIM B11640 TaxID=3133973 RepID=UPI003C7BEA79